MHSIPFHSFNCSFRKLDKENMPSDGNNAFTQESDIASTQHHGHLHPPQSQLKINTATAAISEDHKINNGGMEESSGVVSAVSKIDPSEPLYCFCRQVSFGDMVECDSGEVSYIKV